MGNLILDMRSGDHLVLDGVWIHFRNKVRIEIQNQARFLFGKQIMPKERATTPIRLVYYHLQEAYIGAPDKREASLDEAVSLATSLEDETRHRLVTDALRQAIDHAREDQFYRALRIVRRLIQLEDRDGPIRSSAPPVAGAPAEQSALV